MATAVFFDVDGTLTRTNILQPLLWYQRAHLSRLRFLLWALRLSSVLPYYWWVDRRDRGRVNELIYLNYAGFDARKLRQWHHQTFGENFLRYLRQDAVSCIRQHQEAGRQVVFVTGGLDFVMAPLGEHLGVTSVIATHLEEKEGILTGAIDGIPLAAMEKAERTRSFSRTHNIDLAASYAYADSRSDLPFLECVGHPVAVNPDKTLRTIAGARAWSVEIWR